MDSKLTFLAAYDDLMRNAKVFQVMIEPGSTMCLVMVNKGLGCSTPI